MLSAFNPLDDSLTVDGSISPAQTAFSTVQVYDSDGRHIGQGRVVDTMSPSYRSRLCRELRIDSGAHAIELSQRLCSLRADIGAERGAVNATARRQASALGLFVVHNQRGA